MKKRFLLIAGDECYPAVTRDWVGFFETREEAERHVSEKPAQRLREAKITMNGHYREVDWYEIIDLESWKFTLYDEGELRWGWYPIDDARKDLEKNED